MKRVWEARERHSFTLTPGIWLRSDADAFLPTRVYTPMIGVCVPLRALPRAFVEKWAGKRTFWHLGEEGYEVSDWPCEGSDEAGGAGWSNYAHWAGQNRDKYIWVVKELAGELGPAYAWEEAANQWGEVCP